MAKPKKKPKQPGPLPTGEWKSADLAKALKVAPSTVWQWCNARRIKARWVQRGLRTRSWRIAGNVADGLLARKAEGRPFFDAK